MRRNWRDGGVCGGGGVGKGVIHMLCTQIHTT